VSAGSVSENDESSDEVDVVSVSSCCASAPVSVVRELLVLPRACSLLARVTAMHNYSSSSSGHLTSSSSSAAATAVAGDGDAIYSASAPQSPSVSTTDRPPVRQRVERYRRCLSTPASPSHHHATTTTTTTTTALLRRSSGRRRRGRGSRQPVTEWIGSDESDCGGSGGHVGGVSGGRVGGVKRAHHNVLERRRRDDLKWSFEALRAVVAGSVSGTAADVRVPKVAILRHARDHVRQLTSTSQRLNAEYRRLKAVHERWAYKLQCLTSKHTGHEMTSLDTDDNDDDGDDVSTWLRRSEH